MEVTPIATNDLELIYEQLKDKYDLQLSADKTILSGNAALGAFQLTGEDDEFFFLIRFTKRYRTFWSPIIGEKYYHCHPSSIEDAQKCVTGFMNGTRKYFF